MAAASSSFQRWATSFASGSSGLGAPNSAWMESKMVRICRAGDQLSRHQLNLKPSTPAVNLWKAHSSKHPSRFAPGDRYWGGKSSSRTESWAVSWDSPLARIVRGGIFPLQQASALFPTDSCRMPGIATFIRRLCRTVNSDVEISQILFMGNGIDTGYSGNNISINDPYVIN